MTTWGPEYSAVPFFAVHRTARLTDDIWRGPNLVNLTTAASVGAAAEAAASGGGASGKRGHVWLHAVLQQLQSCSCSLAVT